ncbi:hypothetical protein ACKVWC_004411 [Pyricularia oryzae]
MGDLDTRLHGLGPSIEKTDGDWWHPGRFHWHSDQDSSPYLVQYGSRDKESNVGARPRRHLHRGIVDQGSHSCGNWDPRRRKQGQLGHFVKDVLPAFNSRGKTLQEHVTLTDILSHRTDMSWADNLWLGTESNVLISGANVIKFINNQTLLAPFRAQFGYSNLCYELAGYLIDALNGQSYFDFVKSRLLDPLGMSRTFLQTPPADVDNNSVCYNTLGDKSTAPITCAKTRTDRDWLI